LTQTEPHVPLPRIMNPSLPALFLVGSLLSAYVFGVTIDPRQAILPQPITWIGMAVTGLLALASISLYAYLQRMRSRGMTLDAATMKRGRTLLLVAAAIAAIALTFWSPPHRFAWLALVAQLAAVAVCVLLVVRVLQARYRLPGAYQRGQAALREGDFDGAQQALDELSPDSIETLHLRAMLGRTMGDYDGARTDAEAVIALRPDLCYGYSELGQTELAGGHPARAVDALHRAIEISPYLAQGYVHLGDALRATKAWSEAADAYSHALRLGLGDEADNLIALFRLCDAYERLGDERGQRRSLRRLKRRKRQVRYWLEDLDEKPKGDKRVREDRKLAQQIMSLILGD